MSYMMQPQIILLKDGTDSSQGKAQLISNINACQAVVDVVRTTLGPRGMDKLVFDGRQSTVSNDGATIMKLLEIVHPAAKTLVDISMSQDSEVGDGTTSVVLMAGEFLKASKTFVEDNVHPQIIMKAYRDASAIALRRLDEIAVGVAESDVAGRREMLERCAGTALNSKLLARHKWKFCPMVVDAVEHLTDDRDLALVGIKKVPGGNVLDSFMVEGVAFKKTFAYAGFEQQPKKFDNPKILLLNVELELKSEKENAEVRITDPTEYQSFVDAEWDIIYEKLQKCVDCGANIVLSKLPIGDLATQFFADRNIFCAGRVQADDLVRTARATGAVMQTSVHGFEESVLGTCEKFEEKQIGDERYNLFSGCKRASTATIVLRGGSEQFIEESERSIHDALCIVRRCMMSTRVVAGGGAVEMELSRCLKAHARGIQGKEQLLIEAFARALEVIPRQLCDNAGFDSTNVLNMLRQKHFSEPDAGRWFGVDIKGEGICDTMASNVWEPAANRMNSIAAATEAACLVLCVDETVRNPKSDVPQGGGGMPGGQPMSAAMGGQGLRQMGMGGGGRGGGRGRGLNVGKGVKAFQGRAGA